MIRRLHLFAICISVLVFAPCSLNSEGSVQRFHVQYEEIADDVLEETIGIFSLASEESQKDVFSVFISNDGVFEKDEKQLDWRKDTTPISNFGFLVEYVLMSRAYPVVEQKGDYYNIIIDPKSDKRVWVSMSNLDEYFQVRVIIFERIDFPNVFGEMVNIYWGAKEEQRVLYKEPRDDSKNKVITKKEYPGLCVLSYNNGFIKVTPRNKLPDLNVWELKKYTGEVEYLGWIKLRDEDGRLTIWRFRIDEY